MSTELAMSVPPQTAMMLDHPGWLTSPDGRARRAFRSGQTVWTVVCEPTSDVSAPTVEMHSAEANIPKDHPNGDWFDPAILPQPLRNSPLIAGSPRLFRIRNPDIWDALLPLVLRHRVNATHAARMYWKLCKTYGTTVMTKAGPTLLPPTPEIVTTLTDQAFATIGLRDKAERLHCVATAYMDHGRAWQQRTATELFVELQTVRFVGRWTACAAIADVNNDYSLYTFAGATGHDINFALNMYPSEAELRSWRGDLNQKQISTLVALALNAKITARRIKA